MERLTGKTALIAAAGQGIGRACAERMARDGARPLGAIAGDRPMDDAWIDRPRRLIAKTRPVHHPGAEVLQDHTGALDQIMLRGPVSRVLHVHRDGPLVAVDRVEDRAFPANPCVRQIQPARKITRPRAFDLHHIGPQIGQLQRGIGASQMGKRVQISGRAVRAETATPVPPSADPFGPPCPMAGMS